MVTPQHRDIHFWRADLTEPPCGTLEQYFDWSDDIEDVTCEMCREILARAGGRAGSDERIGEHPVA